jgi:eukaryotic-like serine/threonine-protein kinase
MAPDERHSSLVGQHLGVYQVLAPIGAGGMGEVYRARDTTLARDVAVKVLPPAVTADRERLERFEREARLLAALNHPNIAHVYGFEKATGIPALVMELVEGPTLLDRIARGPIPSMKPSPSRSSWRARSTPRTNAASSIAI